MVEADRRDPAVRAELQAAWERGQARWPGVRVDLERFTGYLETRLDDQADTVAAIRRARAEDLYLACGCADAVPAAVAEFEGCFGAALGQAASAVVDPFLRSDDLAAVVRAKLLVGTAERGPAIASYRGRGSLLGWLRVSARRAALDAVRNSHPETDPLRGPQAQPPDVADAFDDPEVLVLRRDFHGAVTEALRTAFAGLPARDQLLLRHSVLHGLSARKIAKMLDVHHASAARWINEARAQLVERTRSELGQALQLSESSLRSLVAALTGELDLSLARILR